MKTRFRLNQARSVKLVINARHPKHGKYHLFRAIVTPKSLVISKDPDPGADNRSKLTLATTELQIDPTQWHTLTAELVNDQVLLHINDKFMTRAKHEKLNVRKSSFKFGMAGPVAQLDDIRLYHAKVIPSP